MYVSTKYKSFYLMSTTVKDRTCVVNYITQMKY